MVPVISPGVRRSTESPPVKTMLIPVAAPVRVTGPSLPRRNTPLPDTGPSPSPVLATMVPLSTSGAANDPLPLICSVAPRSTVIAPWAAWPPDDPTSIDDVASRFTVGTTPLTASDCKVNAPA